MMIGRKGEGTPKFYGAVVVGKRGQIVIPAEARHNMKINPGEKLIILGGPQRRGLMITKAESILEFLGKAVEHMTHFESMIKADNEPPE